MDYSPNTLIISYDEAIGKEPLLSAIEEYNATILYDYHIINAVSIRIPDGTELEAAIEFFQTVDGVLFVNKDYIYQIDDPIDFKYDY